MIHGPTGPSGVVAEAAKLLSDQSCPSLRPFVDVMSNTMLRMSICVPAPIACDHTMCMGSMRTCAIVSIPNGAELGCLSE